DILDDTGKVIARLDTESFVANGDDALLANSVVIVHAPDFVPFDSITGVSQPFSITATSGQITFSYGPYAPVTTGVFDPTSNWQKPRTLRLHFWTDTTGANYRSIINLIGTTFTTASYDTTPPSAPT